MALVIKPSGNFVVATTENTTYRTYQVKEKYPVLYSESAIYSDGSWIEFIYAGNKLVKRVTLVDNNLNLQDLYLTTYEDRYTPGSKYEHQYIGLKSDNTVYRSKEYINASPTMNAIGFRFTPLQLSKINTTNHTATQGYYSDFGIDLYHDGTKLYRASTTLGGVKCYMYYFNEYLLAVYNHSDVGEVALSYFGAEIPYSIRSCYLPRNTLIFVNYNSIENMVNSFAPSSSSPSESISKTIKISISSSLDSVVFEDSFNNPIVL